MRNKDHLQYKKILDQNLKIAPEHHILQLREQVISDIKQQDENKIKNWIKAIKIMIKDKIPSKPKFYALLLLKEMLATKDKTVVGYFASKLRQRLFLIAHHKSKSNLSLEERGRDCLKKYYSNKNEENIQFSVKFFILLWECWKEWDQMFGDKIKDIKNKTKILQKDFPQKNTYYNFFEDKFGLERDQFQTLDHYSVIYDTKSNFTSSQQTHGKKDQLLDQVFLKNVQDLQTEIEKLSHVFGNKQNAQRYNFQDFELINQHLKQCQNYFEQNECEQIQHMEEKQQQQLQKDFLYFENTLLIFDKFKNQQIDDDAFKQYMYQLYSQYYEDTFDKRNQRKFSTLQPIIEESKEFEESKYNREGSINTRRKSMYSIEWSKREDFFGDFEKKPRQKQNEEYLKHDYSPQLTKSMKKQTNTPFNNKNFSQYSLKNDENFSQISRQLNDRNETQNDLEPIKTSRSRFQKQEKEPEAFDDEINFDDFPEFQTEQDHMSTAKLSNHFQKNQSNEIQSKEKQFGRDLQNFDNFDNFADFDKPKTKQIQRSSTSQEQRKSYKNNFDDFNEFGDFKNSKEFNQTKLKKSMPESSQKNIEKDNIFADFNEFNKVENNIDNFSENFSQTKQSLEHDHDENINQDIKSQNSFEDDVKEDKNSMQNKKYTQKQSEKELNHFDDFDNFNNIQFNKQETKGEDEQEDFKSFQKENNKDIEEEFQETHPKNLYTRKDKNNDLIDDLGFKENEQQNFQQQEQKIKVTEKVQDMFDFNNFQIDNFNQETLQKKQTEFKFDENQLKTSQKQLEEDLDFNINEYQNNKFSESQKLKITQDNNSKISSKRSSKKSHKFQRDTYNSQDNEVFKTINKINSMQSDDDQDLENQKSIVQKIKINRNKESLYQIQSNNLENQNIKSYNLGPSQVQEISTLKKNYENLQNEYQKMVKNYATISQIDLDKFQFLLPKQKGLINQYFDQKIFERKNQFLQNQNRILKQLNEELVNSSQNLQAKRLSEAHVMKQLLKNYNDLVANLKVEQKQLFEQAQEKDKQNKVLMQKFKKQSLYVEKLKEQHQQIQKDVYKLQNPIEEEFNYEMSQQRNSVNSNNTSKKQAKLKQKYKQNDVSMHFEKLSKGSIEPIQPRVNQSHQNNSMLQKMYKQLQIQKNNDLRNSQKTLDLNQDNLDLDIHDITENSLKEIIKDQTSFLKPSKDQKFSNYTMLNYPVYKSDKTNLLSLKASSLFDNSLLFKNDLIQISCLSKNFIHRSEKIVTLKLQYTPLQQNLKISTRVESYENIQSMPQFMINQFFGTQIDQDFTFKTIGQFKNSAFQKLLVKITQDNNVQEINIPLPFTINKFLEFEQIDSNKLDDFLANAQYLKETTITIDPDIIPSFENLIQVFPSIIVLSETQFLLYVKFDYTKCMVLNMCQENENRIKLDILGKKMVQEFEWFYQWFSWIFTN